MPTAWTPQKSSTPDHPQEPTVRRRLKLQHDSRAAWNGLRDMTSFVPYHSLLECDFVMAAQLLIGKSAAISGGVTGIGRAIALEYLRHGASVTVNHLGDARSQQDFRVLVSEAPKGAKLSDLAGDIGKRSIGRDLVEATVENGGGIDVFVANAGVSQFRDFLTYGHSMS
jgi:hypothetical protein